jgi:hypothetical protein
VVVGKAVSLENRLDPGKKVGEHVFAGLPLGLDENELLAGFQTAGIRVGREIGDEIGVGPFNETPEKAADIPQVNRGSHDQHVAFPDAFQNRSQVILENTLVRFGLAGHARLAAPVMEFIQDEGLNLGAQLCGGITEPFRQDLTVAIPPGTSEHTGYSHNRSSLFHENFQHKNCNST